MVNNLKIKKYWIVTLCMVFCSLSCFAQDLSDATIGFDIARTTASLKEHGVKDQDMDREISLIRDLQLRQYRDIRKIEENNKKALTNKAALASPEILAQEKAALIALYNSTNGAAWTNTLNNQGAWPVNDPNSVVTSWNSITGTGWYGITVNSNGNVTSISLPTNQLTGTIPPEIKQLSQVSILSLHLNKLSGSIIPEIGQLSQLTYLTLGDNLLSGALPSEFYRLTKLQSLSLSNNKLSGSLSSEIGSLINLDYLVIRFNQFTGIIPPQIGLLTKLKNLFLDQNKFEGSLPGEIGQLSVLETLELSSNQLTGTIPPQIGQLKSLKYISLQANAIEGVIIPEIFSMTNLTTLNLAFNKLTGVIPTQINALTKLQSLTLTSNNLTGTIPLEICQLTNLIVLTIANNQLTGNIPVEFSQLTKIQTLAISQNKLTGTIPPGMFKFYNVTFLDLSRNQLTGTIPSEIGQLPLLRTLQLQENNLEGLIPDLPYTNMSTWYVRDNKFRFTDFGLQSDNMLIKGVYAPQAKTDTEETITKTVNDSATFTMYTDGRFTADDTYQWYKGIYPGGTLIPEATNRQYILSNLQKTHSGDYYCLSKNPRLTQPASSLRNLILVRNQIHLDITICISNTEGAIKSTTEKFYTNSESSFAFESNATGLTYEWSVNPPNGTAISNKLDSYKHTFTEAGDYEVKLIITDANGCTNTFTKAIKVVDRYCAKEPVDFAFETTSTNLNYTWTSTDSSGTIVNTVTNRTGLYTFTPQLPGDYVIELVANGASQCVSLFTKNITIDECVPFISCTKDNPLSPEMHRLFITMISKLATAPSGSDVNVYAHKEIAAMAPYTTEKTAMIYNFINTSSAISFSFTKTATESDVYLPKSATGSITAIDLSKYEDALTATTVTTTYNNGIPNTKDGHVKNIDFCPKELSCVSHVALVIDESGSIDATEFNKIKKQLKSFVLQQAKTNDDIGSNIHVSITGMSDSDANTRTDYIAPVKMTMSNVGQFNDWIDKLGKRYGRTGISQASDYWKSGLDGALAYQMKPTFVIMVTDGAQTDDVAGLRATFKKFNNNNKAETEPKLPHLYVVGIENGFYIDRDSYTSKGIPRDQDPNYNPSLAPKDNLTARTTPFLTKSLQYLLDLTPTEWPLSDINQFTVGTYYGHDNFELLASDETYFSDKLADGKVVCGTAAIKDFCDDCFSFKPEPGKEYILSAWVKEESFIQVKNYENPAIKIVFYNNKEALDIPAQRIDSLVVKANGDIIDGWQRVVKKFKIPTATITMAIELENMSPSIPVYFDDIRIHPLQGSVKSFVYDPVTFKLMSELDENNYSTFYEYDNEGGLVRVKKETAKGIKTIQETRSGSVINITQ